MVDFTAVLQDIAQGWVHVVHRDWSSAPTIAFPGFACQQVSNKYKHSLGQAALVTCTSSSRKKKKKEKRKKHILAEVQAPSSVALVISVR